MKPDDIVMTIDANAFVMTPNVLKPIYDNPDLLIWVYQYENTANIPEGIGGSFNENFIAAYADVWELIVDPGSNGDLDQSWIDRKIDEIGLKEVESDDKWYYDQWITTYGILRNRLCSVPEQSGLWNIPGLKRNGVIFDPRQDDSQKCWHGKHHQDCNKMIRIVPYGCKWWHFYPEESFKDHVRKFKELTGDFYTLDMLDMFGDDESKQRPKHMKDF